MRSLSQFSSREKRGGEIFWTHSHFLPVSPSSHPLSLLNLRSLGLGSGTVRRVVVVFTAIEKEGGKDLCRPP